MLFVRVKRKSQNKQNDQIGFDDLHSVYRFLGKRVAGAAREGQKPVMVLSHPVTVAGIARVRWQGKGNIGGTSPALASIREIFE